MIYMKIAYIHVPFKSADMKLCRLYVTADMAEISTAHKNVCLQYKESVML